MTNQTRAKNLNPNAANGGQYASRQRSEPSTTLPAASRGFQDIIEARHHMSHLKDSIPVGADILVDGKLMQRQPELGGSPFGHPDERNRIHFGYGPGRYNASVSVGGLKAGHYDLQIPES